MRYAHASFKMCHSIDKPFNCLQILRGLSKILNTRDPKTENFCIGNTSRPLLSCGPRGTKGGRRTYLYVEAIRKFVDEVKEIDLTEAYRRAKPAYVGRMEHTFIVLKETEEEKAVSGSNQEPLGNKRPGSGDMGGASKRHAT